MAILNIGGGLALIAFAVFIGWASFVESLGNSTTIAYGVDVAGLLGILSGLQMLVWK